MIKTHLILDTTRITFIPYYGGLKGQSLQITENSKGEIISATVVKTPSTFGPSESEQTEIDINPTELENPPLPSKYDTEHVEGYDEYIKNIQSKAAEIVKLQEKAKRHGELTEEEHSTYKQHMTSINESAQKLAVAQENTGLLFENREGLSQWFERKKETSKEKNKKKEEEQEKKRKKEEEESKKEEEEDDNEGVAVNLPPEDASVAEAKPIGLAIAGEGGVAASKPIATAVVGPGGLAIARPVGTAIAGVSPDQALVPIYAEGLSSGSHKNKTKNKTEMSEFLNKIISKYHEA